MAGVGAVRPAVRVEGSGLIFADDFTPDDLTKQAAALMNMNGWRTFSDGNAAFDQLMSAVLETTTMK